MISASSRLASCLTESGSRRNARSALKNMKLTNWRWVEVASARAVCAWGSTVVVIMPAIVSPSVRRADADGRRDGLDENARHAAIGRLAGGAVVGGAERAARQDGQRRRERLVGAHGH